MGKTGKTGKKSIVGNIIWVVITGAILFLFVATHAACMFGKPKDINEMLANGETPKKGDYVCINVDAVVDWYAETEYKINGVIPAGTKRHCIVWVDDVTFMSLTVQGKDNYEAIDEIMQGTWSYLAYTSASLPSPKKYEGTISSISSEVSGYYDDAVSYHDLSPAYGLEVLDLDIDTTNNKNSAYTYSLIFLALFAGGIIFLIKDINHNKKVAAAPAMTYTAPMQDPVFGNMMQAGQQTQNPSSMTDDNNNLYR